MKKIIVDVDFTISKKVKSYSDAVPNTRMISMLKKYKAKGYYITLYSARNMKTFHGDIEKIMEITYPEMEEWLLRNNVPFDEIILGKPWNDEGFYIDDNAVRPLEFLSMDDSEILDMLQKERDELWK